MLPVLGSDNYAPVHPEVLAAVAAANEGPAVAYGADPWTARLDARVRDVFGSGARVFPVLTGTGANVVALLATTSRWAGVVASDVAHAHTDENGAPERVGGLKLLTCPSTDGKLRPADVTAWAGDLGDVHRAQPQVLTVTQSTELGTVYTVDELRALVDAAHGLGMVMHLDGSRLANAAASLGVGLRALTTDVGVDLVSFGAAKNGGMIGEAVVVLGPDDAPTAHAAAARQAAADAVPFLRKSTMQLAAKLRYVSAQLLALLADDDDGGSDRGAALTSGPDGGAVDLGGPGRPGGPLWLRNARAANTAAQRLRAGVEALCGRHAGGADRVGADLAGAPTASTAVVRLTRPTEANAVFVTLPRTVAARLRERTAFPDWADGESPDRVEVRWMCSWSTTAEEIDAFLTALAAVLRDA